MKKHLLLPTTLIYLFLTIFLIRFFLAQNYEFVGYVLVTGILYYIVLVLDKKYNFPKIAIWLFASWVVMHMLGGGLIINGTRLYATMLVDFIGDPYYILKYDQFVHAFCYFTVAILVYFALKKHLKGESPFFLIFFTILAATGIGMLNEIVEFGMVVFAGAADAVGGYYNTALDMVFNLVGAVVGTLYARRFLTK
jgi:uncharacterized membrane protein YjdF